MDTHLRGSSRALEGSITVGMDENFRHTVAVAPDELCDLFLVMLRWWSLLIVSRSERVSSRHLSMGSMSMGTYDKSLERFRRVDHNGSG